MKNLLIYLQLQLRVKKNITFNRRYAQLWTILLIGFFILLYGISRSDFYDVFSRIFKKSVWQDKTVFLSMVLSIFMFVTFFYRYMFRIHFDLSGGRSGYLPIAKSNMVLAELFFNLFDFWSLLLTIVFYKLVHFLNIYSRFSQYILAGVIFVLFLLSVNLTVRLFLSVIEWSVKLSGYIGVKLAAGTNFLLVCLMSIFAAILYVTIEPENLISQLTMKVFIYLPPGLATRTLAALMGKEGAFILPLLLLSGYIMILYSLIFLLAGKDHESQRLRNAPTGIRTMKKLLQRMNNIFLILLSKEILYLFRSTRFRLILFFAVFFSFIYLNADLSQTHETSYLNLVLLNAGSIYLSFESTSNWLHEKAAVTFYFYSGQNFKMLIFAKNLAFFFWVVIVEIISLICALLVQPQLMGAETIVLAFLFLSSFFWLMIIPINYFAFRWPKKVSYESFFSKSMTSFTTAVFMVPVIGGFVYCYIPFLFNHLITNLLSGGLAVLSMIIYFLSLNFIKTQIIQGRDHYIETVT